MYHRRSMTGQILNLAHCMPYSFAVTCYFALGFCEVKLPRLGRCVPRTAASEAAPPRWRVASSRSAGRAWSGSRALGRRAWRRNCKEGLKWLDVLWLVSCADIAFLLVLHVKMDPGLAKAKLTGKKQ